MRTAIHSTDVVGKAKDAVRIGIGAPLQSSLHLHTILFGIHINDVWMEGILFRVHVGDIFLDAAFVEIGFLVGLARLVTG